MENKLAQFVAVVPFEMSAASLAVSNVLAVLILLDLDIAAAGAAPIDTEDLATIFEDFEFALFFWCCV